MIKLNRKIKQLIQVCQDIVRVTPLHLYEIKRVVKSNKKDLSINRESKAETARAELHKENGTYQVKRDESTDVLFKIVKYGVLLCMFGMAVKWLLF
ncbi:hypothetical protein CN587_18480 [Bacillus wiedmannii]|nr:hypothetical protein CN562_05665 [Bacillus wiedmannii]PEQ03306.1 hypothetical protein CN587_18480 [Bacillus wiedmannii]PFX61615.1 hypothetical protein COL36_10420 [Bacillus wiedmannii]